jgi:hypothetical protein
MTARRGETDMGDIGKERREVEFEPLDEPGRAPAPEPAPEPVEVPAGSPAPA